MRKQQELERRPKRSWTVRRIFYI